MPFSYSYSILVTWCKDLPEHTFLINLKKIRSLDFYIKCFFINVPWYQTLNVSPFSLKGFPGEFILVHFNWMQSMGIFNSYKIKLVTELENLTINWDTVTRSYIWTCTVLKFLKCLNCGKTLIEENDTPQKRVRSPIVPALDMIFYGS